MLPTLEPNDEVLVALGRSVGVGDIVLARHPYQRDLHLLKRVKCVDAEGRLELVGDNPSESTDSRSFGSVSIDSVLGLVTSRF